MINDDTVNLIKMLLSTSSPGEQEKIILEYAITNIEKIETQPLSDLRIFLKERIIKKSEQGKVAIQKRVRDKKPNGKNYGKPKFFSDNRFEFTCGCCGQKSKSQNVFKHKKEGKYSFWHAIEECFPAEFKNEMSSDSNYIKFVNGVK